MKEDYRKGLSPSRRRARAHYRIRQSLKAGKRTFSQLLSETGVGRSTLAFHLKDMFAKGEVERETNPSDCRITVYKLKSMWTPEIQKEEDIETLSSMQAVPKLGQDLEFLRPVLLELALPTGELSEIMKEYACHSVYVDRSKKGIVEDKNMKQLLEKASSAAMRELLLSEPQFLEKLSDFGLVIRFKKLKELAQMLEEAKKEAKRRTVKIPSKPSEPA